MNSIVDRQYVGKTIKIYDKHVNFAPPNNSQGSIPPTKEEQNKFGFCDTSIVSADTLEATCNAPQNKKKTSMIIHEDLDALVETALEKKMGISK